MDVMLGVAEKDDLSTFASYQILCINTKLINRVAVLAFLQ